MIRRFICAGIVSLVVCAFILPIKRWNKSYLLSAYGIHLHHTVSIQFVGVLHATKFVLAESFHGCRYVLCS
ncbi:hypothetical protein Hanom_Chr01g00089231 [Helianthus anomalus]